MKQTTLAKPKNVEKNWLIIDATDIVLGRLATEVATLIRGKHKPNFTPTVDGGDYVIVINCDKIKLTGNKLDGESWYDHSEWRGGLRERTGRVMVQKYSDELIKRVVKGMLPHNKLSHKIINHLFVYKNADHKHTAQNPKEYKITK